MDDEKYYKQAKKAIAAKRGFRILAFIFGLLTPVLIFINLWTSPGYLWFLWSLMGFSIALAIVYFFAYIKPKYDRKDELEIQNETERLRRRDREILDLEPRRRDELDDRMDLREVRKDYDERDFV